MMVKVQAGAVAVPLRYWRVKVLSGTATVMNTRVA